nr:immunoglobulin heavy chain junction region [Mus musculus]
CAILTTVVATDYW